MLSTNEPSRNVLPYEPRAAHARVMIFRQFQAAIGLIGIVLLSIVLSPRNRFGEIIFFQSGNLTDVLRQVSVVGVMALAMTYVVLTAGIDLSVGSILALSTCVLAKVLTQWTPQNLNFVAHASLAVGAALLASMAVGMVNGLVISRLTVPPFIVTLAAMIGIRGLAKYITNNATLDIGFGDDAAAEFARVVGSKTFAITTFLALACLLWILLSRTVFGRYVRAVGDNEKAARYSGLPIRWVKIRVYAMSGLFAELAIAR